MQRGNMEQREAYVTDTQQPQEVISCNDCQFVIGPLRTIRGGHIVVMLGGFPLYALHGYCPRCGGKINWTGNDERLKRLMKRAGNG